MIHGVLLHFNGTKRQNGEDEKKITLSTEDEMLACANVPRETFFLDIIFHTFVL
jgi:hypothetical protein